VTKTLAERAAEALPCDVGCLDSFISPLFNGHLLDCPARHRPAVLDALRELREECAELAEKHGPESYGNVHPDATLHGRIRRLGD